jgi:hypothetical protein
MELFIWNRRGETLIRYTPTGNPTQAWNENPPTHPGIQTIKHYTLSIGLDTLRFRLGMDLLSRTWLNVEHIMVLQALLREIPLTRYNK